MPTSGYVFIQGGGIDVGSHGSHDYLLHSGDPVNDNGDSGIVFESGTGLGGVRVLEDFEVFDPNDYGGDTGSWSRVTSPVIQGSWAGKLDGGDAGDPIGVSDTSVTLTAPITFRAWFRVGTANMSPTIYFFTQSETAIPECLNVAIEDEDNTFEMNYESGDTGLGGDEFASTSFNPALDTWYECEFDVNSDASSVSAELFDAAGNSVAGPISGTPSTQLTTGGYGFGHGAPSGGGVTYYDNYRIV